MIATLLKRSLEEDRMLEIIYLSEKGALTQRKIRVLRIENDRIRAYCCLRRMKRTFRLDNILSARILQERYPLPG